MRTRNPIGMANSAAPIRKAATRTFVSSGTDFIVAIPRGNNRAKAVIRPGENLPRVRINGSTCMKAPLINMSPGNPKAAVGQAGAIATATAPITTTRQLVM